MVVTTSRGNVWFWHEADISQLASLGQLLTQSGQLHSLMSDRQEIAVLIS